MSDALHLAFAIMVPVSIVGILNMKYYRIDYFPDSEYWNIHNIIGLLGLMFYILLVTFYNKEVFLLLNSRPILTGHPISTIGVGPAIGFVFVLFAKFLAELLVKQKLKILHTIDSIIIRIIGWYFVLTAFYHIVDNVK
jgi:hypothetical protein